jgi:hypothetical protein
MADRLVDIPDAELEQMDTATLRVLASATLFDSELHPALTADHKDIDVDAMDRAELLEHLRGQ